MKLEVLIQMLRNRQEELCTIAADELETLDKKYLELGRSYDAMQSDLLKLFEENRGLKEKLKGKE